MACAGINEQIISYAVLEYDSKGVAYKSDKVFDLDCPALMARYGRIASEGIVATFFKQMFETITSSSGFSAAITNSGAANTMDQIIISWRTPHWRLERIK